MKIEVTIKQAVMLAQGGDNDALIAILKKYQPLIAKGISKSIACGVNAEDLEAVLFLHMITMVHKIDVKRLK